MKWLWYSRRVHASWLLAALFLGVVVGVLISFWQKMPLFTSIAWPLSGGILALIGLWRRSGWLLLVMLVAGGLIGLWRGGNYRLHLEPYAQLIGHTLTMQGKVTEDSDTGERGEVTLRLGNIMIEDNQIKGNIWVSTTKKAEVKRGDIVSIHGKLSEGFGSFAASMYHAELVRVERPTPGDIALTARDWFAGGVRRAIPEPEASLGVGYIVGQRRSLPEDLDKALRATGLTHVVVASGYNLTILVGVARRLFMKVSKFLAAFFSGGMTLAFMAVTGMSPSMSRAGLVTGLGLLAWYYGRRFHPLVLLPMAAAITLLINPQYGQSDLGWQLSFASFAGVLVVGPLLQNYFYGPEPPGVIRQVFFETACAWVCTVPLIVLAFGQLSNVAILANLLVLPLVPLAMLLTFLAGMLALAVPPLAVVAGLPALLVLGYMTRVTHFLGSVSWAQTELTMTPLMVLVYYIMLVVACGYVWRKTKYNFIEQPVTE